MKAPKFSIGQTVTIPKADRSGFTAGKVTAISKIYQSVDADGKFVRNGMRYDLESVGNLIRNTQIDEETIVWHLLGFPGQSSKDDLTKFKEYAYTVVTRHGNLGLLEKHIK